MQSPELRGLEFENLQGRLEKYDLEDSHHLCQLLEMLCWPGRLAGQKLSFMGGPVLWGGGGGEEVTL